MRDTKNNQGEYIMSKNLTFNELIEQKQASSYIFCQKGYRSIFPEEGLSTPYVKDFCSRKFGHIELHESNGVSKDGIEYTYESDWIILKSGLKIKIKI